MLKVNGKELLELSKQGKTAFSDDKKAIIDLATGDILAIFVEAENQEGYFKALGDQISAQGKIEACIEWAWDEHLKIKICVSYSDGK
ncbi:MAG: hypothetical protein MUC49_22570 [Raineya sp.]|jgi:hypothetical protein|nr:hypothetical protein [Raineya sp.]